MARRRFVPLVLFVVLAVAGCSDDDPAEPASSSGSGSTASEAPSSSSTSSSSPSSTEGTVPVEEGGIALTGSVGSGSLVYSLASDRSEFCYRITVQGIGTASEAHVERSDGEVVLALQPPAEGTVDTCAATDALLIQELQSQPGNFVVEVQGPDGTLTATLQ